jgi:L,D-transpeptidase YbiS
MRLAARAIFSGRSPAVIMPMSTSLRIFTIAFVILLILECAGQYLGYREVWPSHKTRLQSREAKLTPDQLKRQNVLLKKRLKNLSPGGVYIVIDTGRNILSLKRGHKTIRKAIISSGSGSILNDPNGKRQWIFDTPRGEYRVKSKHIDPIWRRPDWSYIEEGKTIPEDPSERAVEGMLGRYAVGFDKGYFIHGTLYTRLLGRHVTHGCIRVDDRTLEAVYSAAGIGTKIFIY